ncbi:MAG TPA: right-handed parallel beta-helix repeat-containing protein [Armatimonadota bacterium]|jgi:hypothetical protein
MRCSVLLWVCGALLLSSAAWALGPYPPEIAAWTEATKAQQRQAGEQLLQAMREAAKQGKLTFDIPKGDYRFAMQEKAGNRQVHIALRDFNDMVIDGHGSTFWFEDDQQAVGIWRSKNLTIKNLFLDWDPLGFTQGTVTAVDEAKHAVYVTIDPGYERVTPRMAALASEGGAQPYILAGFIDAATGNFKTGQTGFRVTPFFKDQPVNGAYRVQVLRYYNLPLSVMQVHPGDRMAMWVRGEGGFLIEGCEKIRLQDITLYSCAGFNYREAVCVSNVYERCHILRRPGTNRLLGGNSDGFHSSNCAVGPTIDGCIVEAIGDDGVNIHGFYRKMREQKSPTEVVVEQLAWRGTIEQPFTVDFFENDGVKYLGRRTTVGPTTIAGGLHTLHLDQPITLPKDVIVSSEQFVGAGATVRNCTFRNILTRGMLVQAPNMTIANNRFEWLGSFGLRVASNPGYWGESAHPHNLTITGNTFIDTSVFRPTNMAAAAIYIDNCARNPSEGMPVQNVLIEKNTFLRVRGAGVLSRGVTNLRIIGNTFDGFSLTDPLPLIPGNSPAFAADELGYALLLKAVTGAEVRDNTFTNPGPFSKGVQREVDVIPVL